MSRRQAATSATRASSCFAVQVIAFSRAKARRASSNRPSARSRAAWRCQSTFWRVTSVIATDPCRCLSSAKRPPRSIEASWRSSPARINFASARFASGKQLAHDAAVEHGRLVHDHDGATAPGGQPVLDAEQLGMDRTGAREAALAAQILRDRVRRGEPNHFMPAPLMRLADRGEREALSRAGAPLDDLEAARPDRMLEGGELIRAQRTALEGLGLRPCAHPARSRRGDLRRIRRAPAVPARAPSSS